MAIKGNNIKKVKRKNTIAWIAYSCDKQFEIRDIQPQRENIEERWGIIG